jgi:two-component system, NtrC family, response regulator HydG
MARGHGNERRAKRLDVKGRILLVDDEQDVCELLADLLKGEGADVDFSLDEAEAQGQLSERVYDVVLTDLDLGASSGLGICELVGRQQPGVPVIVVTGHGSLDTAVGAIRAGAYDFITKPIDARDPSQRAGGAGRAGR